MANIKSIGGNPIVLDASGIAAGAVTPDKLADIGGITAGAANGITGNGTDSAAWLQRVSTSDGPTTIRSIKGNTLVWNQLVALSDNTSTPFNNVTRTRSRDGSVTFTGTVEGTGSAQYAILTDRLLKITSGHKYFLTKSNDNLVFYVNVNGSNNRPVAVSSIFTALESSDTASIYIIIPATGYEFGTYVCYPQLIDLTAMFGAGNEPSTVAEFEALFPEPYYEYDAGSLLSVSMTGIETTGFNQWDEEWEVGNINSNTGEPSPATDRIRSKNFCPIFPNTQYYFHNGNYPTTYLFVWYYDADKNFISGTGATNTILTTPANAAYFKLSTYAGNYTAYTHNICVNLSDPTRNGEYEPYWHQERSIPAGTLRSAGAVYDEQTATERITRVGECMVDGTTVKATGATAPSGSATAYRFTVQLPNATFTDSYDFKTSSVFEYSTNALSSDRWEHGDAIFNAWGGTPSLLICIDGPTSVAQANAWLAEHPFTVDYPVTTTVTTYDPPLNLTYRTGQGGTERVIVPTGELSAPPTIVTAQGYTAESLRDAALATIAPIENGLASTNYGVGSYLVHSGQLCRVTTAIATGEAISIGTNVTATTVMAEVIALIAQ